MPLWRCPHCATPQAETARCWVCHRSSTACGACRHFRRGVAGQLGFCGLDRQRRPLQGDEVRGCWEAADATVAGVQALPGVGQVWPLDAADPRTGVRGTGVRGTGVRGTGVRGTGVRARDGRDFVELEPAVDPAIDPAVEPIGLPLPASAADEPRWSLWGESEA